MNLTRIRKAKGLRLADLAELIGMDTSTVQRAEKLHTSAKIETYVKCAEALGCTLADLFAEDRSATEAELVAAFRGMSDLQQAQVLGLLRLAEAQPR
jgi:transcriptional regulator with XRE-family HTH domain